MSTSANSTMHLADTKRFLIREAKEEDAPGMAEAYYRSFYTSGPFWQYLTADTPAVRAWWEEAFRSDLSNPQDKNFVAIDTQKDNKVVAFSRWQIPQSDGDMTRTWPEMQPGDWDLELMGAFFGNMLENRQKMMQKRPHWFLELLGVHDEYQKFGIGASLIRWGTEQADRGGLETYLDGSEKGRPYYEKHHGFVKGLDVPIPDKPAYGSYSYASMVRPPQKST